MKQQKQIFVFLILLVATILWSPFSKAESDGGLFLEPAVTYESGTLKLKYPAPLSDSNETIKGYGLGLRLGMHFHDVLFAALDGRYSQPTYDSSALGNSATATASNFGLTLGVQTPLLGIRVWGTYILDGTLDPGKIGSVDVKYNGMNGYRVGGGIYVAVVSINLEYQETNYKNTVLESLGPFSSGSALDSVSTNQKTYLLSVSFPIAL